MRFLSLDTSTSCTGYAIYDGTTLLSYGNINLKHISKKRGFNPRFFYAIVSSIFSLTSYFTGLLFLKAKNSLYIYSPIR